MSKTLTNLDKIRAMPLDDLTAFLMGCDPDDAGIKWCAVNGECPYAGDCYGYLSEKRDQGCQYHNEDPARTARRRMWRDWLKMEWKEAPEQRKMEPGLAAAVLRRIQEPEAYEPQITQIAFDALEYAIRMLYQEEASAGSSRETDGIKLIIREGGVAEIYDDTYDLTIHCTSADEQREIIRKMNEAFGKESKT